MQQAATDIDTGDRQGKSLQDVRIMNDEGLSFGLPSFLFFGGLGLSVAFAVLLPWFIGLLFGLVYFIAMYQIHAEDPRALRAWVDVLGRPREWSAAAYSGRAVLLLVEVE